MSVIQGAILNCFDSTYNGRFYYAEYDELPSQWSKIGTDYRQLNNDTSAHYFNGAHKYLVVVVMPTGNDLNGTAIAFDQQKFLNQFAQPSQGNTGYRANVIVRMTNAYSNNTFTYKTIDTQQVQTSGSAVVGQVNGAPQYMYCNLNTYSVTSVPNAVTLGVFPYVIGTSVGGVTFGAPDSTGALRIVKPQHGVVVKLNNSLSTMVWILLLFVVFVLIIGATYFVYHHYKKMSP